MRLFSQRPEDYYSDIRPCGSGAVAVLSPALGRVLRGAWNGTV
jgi:hypothetical protein